MDLLKEELERKKKAIALAREKTSSITRFLKSAELRRAQEEEEERLRLKRPIWNISTESPKLNYESKPAPGERGKNKTINSIEILGSGASGQLTNNFSPDEVLLRLRSLGLPIKYFGETLSHRIKRLQKALEQETSQNKNQTEMDELRLGKGHEIRNPFLDRNGEDDAKKDDSRVMDSFSQKKICKRGGRRYNRRSTQTNIQIF
mmetsp:Transcript_2595/g.2977  ORF Transcript_2595/g.2977 Transcript_2595/m.2977 type:complete len:204 (-) Transcript_2595:862-1473(-)